jgi:hypothetical protein
VVVDGCRTLFDGSLWVHYGSMYVMSEVALPEDPFSADDGQQNGLCGARLPGFLYLTTATHTGTVPVRVEAWELEPPVGETWEDVVEASFEPLTDDVCLVQWACEARFPLALVPRRYAVRYGATGLDAALEAEVAQTSPPDRYLLQFWPSDDERDAVVRTGSSFASNRRRAR